jgi:hypothetical protein
MQPELRDCTAAHRAILARMIRARRARYSVIRRPALY